MSSFFPQSIDVHSHFLPPVYCEALVESGHEKPDGMPAIPPWSANAHIEMMVACNISKSILSISSPGTSLAPGRDAREITRYCNAFAANLKKQYPEKFGFWASLPLPETGAALEEIDLAVNEGCDGFSLLTNYHGIYLGAPALELVFDKLNAIRATVFIHPTAPCIAGMCVDPAQTFKAAPFQEQYPIPMFEFLFDTARAVINLFMSGTVDRCPNITFIVPHAGGCFPPLWTRFARFSSIVPSSQKLVEEEVRKQIEQQFYFDLAGFVFEGESGGGGQLKALVEGFGVSHKRMLYGTDFPFTNAAFVKELKTRMKEGLGTMFEEDQCEDIYAKNAVRLLQGKGRAE